jgi:hypothetical protein
MEVITMTKRRVMCDVGVHDGVGRCHRQQKKAH